MGLSWSASVAAGEKAMATLGEEGVFTAPGWRIGPADAGSLALEASVPGVPGDREASALWTMHFHHGPYVAGPPRRASRCFRRLFTIRDEAAGYVHELCHLADRRESTDVGCWIARSLQPHGAGLRIRLLNRGGLLTADPEKLARGDSMGLSMSLAAGSSGDRYRLGDEDFVFPAPPSEPGRRDSRKHTVAPGTRLVVRSDSGAVFTLALGVPGSLDVFTIVTPDRTPVRSLEFSTGEPGLDLWWAPGDAAAPAAVPDTWITAAARATLAGPAAERVQVARKAINSLERLVAETPGVPDHPDLRTRQQAFDMDVRGFTKLLARGRRAGTAWTLDDWIAIASLGERIEESRKTLEMALVTKLIP